MSEEHLLPSESDDDDEDYVPGEQDSVSEVESEGDAETALGDDDHENGEKTNSRVQKRHKKMRNKGVKRKKGQTKDTSSRDEEVEEESVTKVPNEEEEKKRADSLWADFMKDSTVVTKPKSSNSSVNGLPVKSETPQNKPKVTEKIKITKIMEFAGEKIEVEKEVPVDSTEASLSLLGTGKIARNANISPAAGKIEPTDRLATRKVGLGGGLSSVLSNLGGKKSKISTLEKSKLDWDNFKKQENIEEEITNHNRGKDGYLEKQDFLQRADFRQFEIEKQLRSTSRRSNR